MAPKHFWMVGESLMRAGKKGMQAHMRPTSFSMVLGGEGVLGGVCGEGIGVGDVGRYVRD